MPGLTPSQRINWQQELLGILIATTAVAVMTGVMYYLRLEQSPSSLPMLYLLVVTLAALFLGRLSAILAAVEAFFALNYYFVEPRYRLTVQQPAEWLSLCMFLLTAIVTSQLLAMQRARAEEAQRSKQETDALAEASWAVASEPDRDRALSKVLEQLASIVPLRSADLLVVDEHGQRHLLAHFGSPEHDRPDAQEYGGPDPVQLVLDERRAIGWDDTRHGDDALSNGPEPAAVYLPVIIEGTVLGVLHLDRNDRQELSQTQRRVIRSLVNYAAVAIQRDKLVQVEARAQALAEADRLKTALLSMVTHDFRSPLTSIKASVGTLLQEGATSDPGTQRALLEGVDQETDRLNRLVGNILDLSRLEAGAWRPKREMISLTEVVGAALDSFDADANARIQVRLDAKIEEIWVDLVQIVQVLRNLLENALKYSAPDQQVILTAVDRHNTIVIDVLDRGPGLPAGEEAKIFEPFYRGPSVTETSVPGIGIGLAICRGLVEAHGGTIGAANRDGGGAVFRVILPVSELSS